MRIVIIGSNGKMGKSMQKHLNDKCCKYFNIDIDNNNINSILTDEDVLLDFSTPDALDQNLNLAKTHNIPIVIATTGHSQQNLKKIKQYSQTLPILLSSNFSIGFNTLVELLPILSKLNFYDFILTETHHKTKIDSPSGSAKIIKSNIEKLGILPKIISIRAGNEVGEHCLKIYGENESLTICHKANNRQVFCQGAYMACKFMYKKPKGLYLMKDVLNYDNK